MNINALYRLIVTNYQVCISDCFELKACGHE